MIRTIVQAEKTPLEVPIPESYLGKKVEVIAFTVEEGRENVSEKKVTFATLKLDTTNFKFDRDEANSR